MIVVRRFRREGGSVSVVVAVIVVVLALAAVQLGRLGAAASARAAAEGAADAAALAGALDGRRGAEVVAAANDAVLIEFVERDDAVAVTVVRDDVEASAEAARAVTPRPVTVTFTVDR